MAFDSFASLNMEIPDELRIDEKKAVDYTVKWVRDYFKPFKTKKAIVGLSGGSELEAFREYAESFPDDAVLLIDKRTYSRFYNTVLDNFLRNNNIKEVYIAGLVTSICVQNTAADAFFSSGSLL